MFRHWIEDQFQKRQGRLPTRRPCVLVGVKMACQKVRFSMFCSVENDRYMGVIQGMKVDGAVPSPIVQCHSARGVTSSFSFTRSASYLAWNCRK